MVVFKRAFRGQCIHKLKPGCRAERHRNGDRTIQLHDRGRRELGKFPIERHNTRPVGFLGSARSRMTGCNLSLQYEWTVHGGGELFRMRQCCETSADEKLVPVCAVLIEKQNGLSRRAHTRAGTRRLNLHERDQALDLWLLWRELSQNAPEAQRLFAKRRPHPIVAGGSRVTFVEDE